MTSRITLVLFLLVSFLSPAFSADENNPFDESKSPAENFLQENTVKKPSTRMAAPDEDGDGFDQKEPLGAADYIVIGSLVTLCGFYLHRKVRIKE